MTGLNLCQDASYNPGPRMQRQGARAQRHSLSYFYWRRCAFAFASFSRLSALRPRVSFLRAPIVHPIECVLLLGLARQTVVDRLQGFPYCNGSNSLDTAACSFDAGN